LLTKAQALANLALIEVELAWLSATGQINFRQLVTVTIKTRHSTPDHKLPITLVATIKATGLGFFNKFGDGWRTLGHDVDIGGQEQRQRSKDSPAAPLGDGWHGAIVEQRLRGGRLGLFAGLSVATVAPALTVGQNALYFSGCCQG
jgi:hypothetical protein